MFSSCITDFQKKRIRCIPLSLVNLINFSSAPCVLKTKASNNVLSVYIMCTFVGKALHVFRIMVERLDKGESFTYVRGM